MKPNYIVPALDRGLDVLEYLSQDGRAGTVAEITQELKLPRASVFRILHTLQQKGYVTADASGRTYQLGPGVLRLGYQYLATRDIVPFWNVRTACSNSLFPADGVLNMPSLTGGCTCNYLPVSQAYVPSGEIQRVVEP